MQRFSYETRECNWQHSDTFHWNKQQLEGFTLEKDHSTPFLRASPLIWIEIPKEHHWTLCSPVPVSRCRYLHLSNGILSSALGFLSQKNVHLLADVMSSQPVRNARAQRPVRRWALDHANAIASIETQFTEIDSNCRASRNKSFNAIIQLLFHWFIFIENECIETEPFTMWISHGKEYHLRRRQNNTSNANAFMCTYVWLTDVWPWSFIYTILEYFFRRSQTVRHNYPPKSSTELMD